MRDSRLAGRVADLLDGALADVRRRIGRGAVLQIPAGRASARGLDQPLELVEMLLGERPRRRAVRDADEKHFFTAGFGHRRIQSPTRKGIPLHRGGGRESACVGVGVGVAAFRFLATATRSRFAPDPGVAGLGGVRDKILP